MAEAYKLASIESDKGDIEMRIPGDWYSIDFHVHTPASHCFKKRDSGGKTGEEHKLYFWLLEEAQEAELDIIVITDHNDIAGYAKLMELKVELESTRRTLNRENLEIPTKLQNQLGLFEEVIVLPGAEMDIDPNIHMLIIFDPRTPLNQIGNFLHRAGFSEDIRGTETASRDARWNVNAICREAAEIGAIVIAAHVDSSKGLYEASKKWGQKRIAAFTDENLYGMEFINPKSRDQIESILKQPDYARKTPLSFVQSSDFHGGDGEKLGDRQTYVRLDDVKKDAPSIFQALKLALRNPAEYVSAPGRPEVHEIQKRLIDYPHVEGLTSDSDITKLVQYVSAYANTTDGTIVIGRNEYENWVGIRYEGMKEIVQRIVEIIRSGVAPPPNLQVEVYPYYEDLFFATVRVRKQHSIFATADNDRVYLLWRGQLKQATTAEVVKLAEEGLLARYSYLSITDRLTQISQRLGGTRDSLDVLPIVRKIESRTTPFFKLFPKPEKGELLIPSIEEVIEFESNGYDQGSVLMFSPEKQRLSDQYVRVTAPIGRCDLSSSDVAELQRYSGEKMIVVPQGATYFDSTDEVIVVCSKDPPLICQVPNDYEGPDFRFVAAYFKSAIAIWYADRCLGSANFYDVANILRRVPIPHDPLEYEQEVLNIFKQLTDLEYQFLEQEQAIFAEKPNEEEEQEQYEWVESCVSIVNQHNECAGQLLSKLDTIFFNMFELTDEEIEIVQQGIESAGMIAFREWDRDSD